MHRPLVSHWSALHTLSSSSHAVPLGAGAPVHTPAWQASPVVQAFPSSQGVVSATVMPVHTPLWQVSPVVQGLPSSHGVLSGSGVPAQAPSWQVSAAVQKLPSSHFVPVNGVTVQLEVPLQVRVLHWSEVQAITVPT